MFILVSINKVSNELQDCKYILCGDMMYMQNNTTEDHLNYNTNYLLTPWSRVLLEKLNGSAASQEIPRILGTRRFLTVPTSAHHLSLS